MPVVSEVNGHIRHFWVASAPFVETYLIFVPEFCTSRAGERSAAQLTFFDADGIIVNEAEISALAGQAAVLEVGQFLGSCKLESGIRHAHLVLQSRDNAWAACRMTSGASASMLGLFTDINAEQTGFMPVVFSAVRHPVLCAVNYSGEDFDLRCQLFFGSRIPETELVVPGNGARLLALDVEFEQSLSKDAGKTLRAYLRFGVKGNGTGGIQLLELYPAPKNEEFVSGVG